MSALIIPRKFYSQPQGRAVVDWAHPLAQHLLFADSPATRTYPLTSLGGVSEKVFDAPAHGGSLAWEFDGGALPRITVGISVSAGSPVTLCALVRRTTQGSSLNPILTLGSAGASRQVLYDATNGVALYSAGEGGGTQAWDGGGDPRSAKFLQVSAVAGRSRAPAHRDVWVDGVKRSENLTPMGVGPLNVAAVGTHWVSGMPSAGFHGQIWFAAAWSRALSDDEIIEMQARPWQIFRADPVRFYSLAGAGQELSASGAAAATGSAAPSVSLALAGVGVALATGAASPRVEIALSALGFAIASGTAAAGATATGVLAATGSASASGSASAVASVTIAAAGLAQAAATAGLSANVLLAGAGAAQASGDAALAAHLRALAQGAAQASGTANISASAGGQLAAQGKAQAQGSAVLTLAARLAAAGASQAHGSAAIDSGAAQVLAAAGSARAEGAAVATAIVALTAAGFVQAMGAGYLVVQVSMAAAGTAAASGSAAPVDAEAMVLISTPRWRVEAAGRRFVVDAVGRSS